MTEQLPPRPDPETGRPFPPTAPAWKELDREPHSVPDSAEPPEGCGAVLAYWSDTWKTWLVRVLAAVGFTFLAAIAVPILYGDPIFEMFTVWQVWVIAGPIALLMAAPRETQRQLAGADWVEFQTNKVWGKKHSAVLRFYDLVSIELESSGVMLFVTLKDKYGAKISRPLYRLQFDRGIWDLLYNGILHSIKDGADYNHAVIDKLELRSVEAMQPYLPDPK